MTTLGCIHTKTVSMIENDSKPVTSCAVSKSRKSYFVMWTRFVLGYCNLADEDFVDENVKYIREGFEKRVKSIPFIPRIHLSEKFSLHKIFFFIFMMSWSYGRTNINIFLQLYQESKEGSQLCGCKVNNWYFNAWDKWKKTWIRILHKMIKLIYMTINHCNLASISN